MNILIMYFIRILWPYIPPTPPHTPAANIEATYHSVLSVEGATYHCITIPLPQSPPSSHSSYTSIPPDWKRPIGRPIHTWPVLLKHTWAHWTSASRLPGERPLHRIIDSRLFCGHYSRWMAIRCKHSNTLMKESLQGNWNLQFQVFSSLWYLRCNLEYLLLSQYKAWQSAAPTVWKVDLPSNWYTIQQNTA